MIKAEIPERMAMIKAETPEGGVTMSELIEYVYPLMMDSASASVKEEIRKRLYKSGLSDWDLMKVMRAMDGETEED